MKRVVRTRVADHEGAHARQLGFLIIVLFSLAFLWAMAAAGMARADDAANDAALENGAGDPLEHVNRFTSDFNRALRDALIDPLVDGYQAVTPEPVQTGVSNAFSNLSEPVTVISSILQGDTENAGNAAGRFLINSTLGLAGTSDRATEMGVEARREDLGQAFGAHGMDSGPHIVLPILGPSNFRDATGTLLTGLASPLPMAVHAADGGVRYADNQDAIQAIGSGAVDPYVAEREAYEQNRAYEVSNGAAPETEFPAFAEPADGRSVATSNR